MSIFEDVTLTWEGKDFTVKSDKVLMLIASIEEVITLQQLSNGSPSLAKLAMGYGKALRYAGAKVADDQIYRSFFGGKEQSENATNAIFGLLSMMIPPEALQGSEPKGKSKPAARKKKAV